MTGCWLLADVGGTNARFALSHIEGQISRLRSYRTAEQPTFAHALNSYLQFIGAKQGTTPITGACIAAAGPLEKGMVKLTNSPWCISAQDVCDAIGGGPVRLFNDLEAVAMLLPQLGDADSQTLGAPRAAPSAGNLLAVNIGTGLGAASAISVRNEEWIFAAGEAGHMTFSATTPNEFTLLPHVSSLEDVLSGRGAVWLYKFLASRSDGQRQGSRVSPGGNDAAQVFANVGYDQAAVQVVSIITELLARVTSDLVLASGAWRGAYLCGSVAMGWHKVADERLFRSIFERKGAMSPRMERVPTALITTPEPALRGLTYAKR